MKLDLAPKIIERALAEWRKQQTLKKGKTSVTVFADFLNYSQSSVSQWVNGGKAVSEDALIAIAPKLAELLGEEIYDELEIEKPDLMLDYVNNNWKNVSKQKKEKIAKLIEEDTKRPVPHEPKTKPIKS
jgi:transcriptional regulator with XRE-family HTH domain